MRRALGRTRVLAGSTIVAALACASGGGPPHESIGPLWRSYAKLAPNRALAVAGDPYRVWVGAAVGGFESRAAASDAALAECQRKRRQRRMRSPCLLYAVDTEIVWPVP